MTKTRNRFDNPLSLMKETKRLLKARDLLEVYAETRVPFYWLRKFAAGEFQNPSVNRVQYLYEHLTGLSLL